MGQAKRVLIERCSKCYASPKAYKLEQNQPMLKLFSEYQSAYKSWPWQPVRQSLKPDTGKGSLNRMKGQMERKSTYGVDYVRYPLELAASNEKAYRGNVKIKFHPPRVEYRSELSALAYEDVYYQTPKKVVIKKQKAELTRPVLDMDASTTYKLEFFAKASDKQVPAKKKKENDNSMQPAKDARFQGDSIYMASYPFYDNKVVAKCRQHPVKIKDNIEIPLSTESEKNARSTARADFVMHEDYERPRPIRPHVNSHDLSEPVQGSTEYNDSYNKKQKDPHICRAILTDGGSVPVKAISTAMADFTWPEGFEPQEPCHPPQSNHFISAKFDGTTTFSMAYKPFKVTPYELPVWAKKPQWKRPVGGMSLNSLYKHDFTDPKVIHPPTPINPRMMHRNIIIKEAAKARKTECVSTYINDFKPWEGSRPPESYRVMEVYTPPKESMNFETNNRSHFRGEYSSKRRPCRHESQHRELNENKYITFITTYNENYQNPRPKSSPVAIPTPCDSQANKSRCNSAGTFVPIPKPNFDPPTNADPPASANPPASVITPASANPPASANTGGSTNSPGSANTPTGSNPTPSANPPPSVNINTSAEDSSKAGTIKILKNTTPTSIGDSTSK